MVGVAEPAVYYKEASKTVKSARFFLKPVSSTANQRPEKKQANSSDNVNVQVVKGKTTTFIHLDEDEAKKVQSHGDLVLKKLHRIHKSVIWNILVGRSFVDKIPKGKEKSEEINLDHDENLDFDPNNPRTWSDESLDFIKSVLKANEFNYDGFVVLFCVANNEKDSNEVDYDEIAWELEKCLTYHFNANRSQIIMNEEAIMSRRGLDPVSRKTKTPGGRKKAGFCVYLAYQLLDNVSSDQMVGEAINRHVDISLKKKQLLASLSGSKFLPQIDERVRKQIKEIREFMTREQLEMVIKLKDIKEGQSMDMLVQFMALLNSKDAGMGSGLPQFLSFLNKSQDDKSSTPRLVGKNPSVITSSTAIPRPSAAGSIRSRKASITSQTVSIVSSRSTTPETPNRRFRDHEIMRSSAASRTGTNSLASIPSSGSLTSIPETLKPSSKRVNGKSGLPQRASNNRAAGMRPVSARPSPLGRPSPSGGASNLRSPSISASNSPRRGSNNFTPPPEGRITREDLRRMNKSYPSSRAGPVASAPGSKKPPSTTIEKKKKPSITSFSRASIPMA